jgi:NAD(P)-dependent dehydrogenase (short-subunit alcohol dehydrogenase family)
MSETFSSSLFTGQVAVVTGAAQGIGEATARLLAERGAAGLLLTDRQADKGEAVAAELRGQGTDARFVPADLADPESPARIIAAADESFGRVDVLANIAGLTDRSGVLDTDLAIWDKMFAINVRSPFFLMQGAIRIMQRERIEGAIVNICSVNAHVGGDRLTPYSASKGALQTLTRNVANAMAPMRIRVNGLNLGWVDTPGEDVTRRTFDGSRPGWQAEAEAQRPFGRLLKPLDVARAIAFLASAESGIMTGTVFDFDQQVVGGYRFAAAPR